MTAHELSDSDSDNLQLKSPRLELADDGREEAYAQAQGGIIRRSALFSFIIITRHRITDFWLRRSWPLPVLKTMLTSHPRRSIKSLGGYAPMCPPRRPNSWIITWSISQVLLCFGVDLWNISNCTQCLHCFTGCKAIDALLKSHWGTGATPLFTERSDVTDFLNDMLQHRFFHRAVKVCWIFCFVRIHSLLFIVLTCFFYVRSQSQSKS